MKVQQLVWAFLLFTLGMIATAHAKLPVVSVKNPDGSLIKASADVEIMVKLTIVQLASQKAIAPTNTVAMAIAKKFPSEIKEQAGKGDDIAQVILGFMYFNGFGVETNLAEAATWFRKSAEHGNADAENNLGACYANGFGVPKDKTEAEKWYHSAGVYEFKEIKMLARQGDADEQYRLGMAYENGQGVPKDSIEATKWYLRAANQGNAQAQNNLAVKYASGDGISMDYVEAYKWFNIAAGQSDFANFVQGNQRDALAQKMTSDQIAEAQRLAREFKPRKESSSDNSTSPKNPTASGSGFFITEDGYLISNYHVVKGATKVRLVTSAGMVNAKVVSVDVANDLALLKANLPWYAPVTDTIVKTNAAPWATIVLHNNMVTKFSPLPISSSRTTQLGGTVATIGFPDPSLQGFSPKLAKGEIASLSGAGDDPRYFQISVPVQPGNSGGALVDERGNVIGIVSAKLNASVALAASGALPENVNYAVKSSLLLSFLESVPDVSAKLKEPIAFDRKFEEVVKSAQDAAVLVLVY